MFCFYLLMLVFDLARWLSFSRRVLGDYAARRLAHKAVTQTIRSDAELLGLVPTDEVDVLLDGMPIGRVRIMSIEKIRLSELDKDDAERGGFAVLDDLKKALMRAGFRFKPLSEYVANRVVFSWM